MADSKDSTSKFTSTLLDSLLAHVAIVDQQGTIIETNKSWKQFNHDSILLRRAPVGENYFEVLQHAIEMGDDYALKILLGLKRILNQDKSSFSITYSLKTNTNAFWFKLTIRPCTDEPSQFIMINEDVTASMQAKYEKQENEDRFKVKFEQSLDGVFITDTNGNIVDANQTASNILGWSRNELTNLSLEAVANVNQSTYASALEERSQTGTYALEMDFIDKQGNVIPTEVSSRTYRNPKGKLRAIVTFHDISRRKKIESDLSKTKQFTESALNSIPGVFVVLDREGHFIRWNENMVTKLEYSAEELEQKRVINIVIDDYKEQTKKEFQQCIEEGEISTETKIHSKNGQIKDYSIFAKRFVEDGSVYIVATAIDITKRKQIEQENRRHQTMMEQLFDNSPVGITIIDNENIIQQVNSSFENIFGYNRQEAKGQNIDSLIAPNDRKNEAKAISLATQKGESLQTETIRINKDGEEIPVLIGSVPVRLENEIIAIYGMYVDISTQHNYRQKLEAALREKEALLSELHHRVKNNLALISSLVELQVFDAENPLLRKELQNIKNRIMTIASIHEVLYQNGSLTNIPFHNFINELVVSSLIQKSVNEHNIEIETDSDEVNLSINQSIPTGLLINELISLIFSFTDSDQSSTLNIRLREYQKKIHLIIEGQNIIACPEEVKSQQSLHNILIQTLVIQLNGTLIWPNTNSDYQKFEFFFTKEQSTSPASNFLQTSNKV
ncbi:MAG: PAS domain S-box protein [Bacteroidota bacterium]